MKYDVTIKWDDKTTHHKDVSDDTPLYYNPPLTVQQIYNLLEAADPTETLQDDPHGTWEIVEFVRQIERYYGIERPEGLFQEWQEWRRSE